MATLRDIQRRIRSVQSTQKITKAMKLVAASKLRRAQERLTAARPYAIKMGELLSGLVGRTEGDAHPLLARRTTGRSGSSSSPPTRASAEPSTPISSAPRWRSCASRAMSTSPSSWWAGRRATSIAAAHGR
jgi:hypothetical protein